MSGYFRHLNDIFAEAGIEVTASNRKHLDQAIHKIMGTSYKDCPATWQKFKQQIKTDVKKRPDFVAQLKSAAG